ALSAPAWAERLPVRAYTVDDGLAGDEINTILQDSRGYLWIGTDTGLSRFDGTRFVEYDSRQGLPNPHVTALLETSSGDLLVGTTGGPARLDLAPASPGPVFRAAPPAPSPRPGPVSDPLAAGRTPPLGGSP